jgi:hypothetical protein
VGGDPFKSRPPADLKTVEPTGMAIMCPLCSIPCRKVGRTKRNTSPRLSSVFRPNGSPPEAIRLCPALQQISGHVRASRRILPAEEIAGSESQGTQHAVGIDPFSLNRLFSFRPGKQSLGPRPAASGEGMVRVEGGTREAIMGCLWGQA